MGGKHIAVFNRSSLKYVRRHLFLDMNNYDSAEGASSTCRGYIVVAVKQLFMAVSDFRLNKLMLFNRALGPQCASTLF